MSQGSLNIGFQVIDRSLERARRDDEWLNTQRSMLLGEQINQRYLAAQTAARKDIMDHQQAIDLSTADANEKLAGIHRVAVLTQEQLINANLANFIMVSEDRNVAVEKLRNFFESYKLQKAQSYSSAFGVGAANGATFAAALDQEIQAAAAQAVRGLPGPAGQAPAPQPTAWNDVRGFSRAPTPADYQTFPGLEKEAGRLHPAVQAAYERHRQTAADEAYRSNRAEVFQALANRVPNLFNNDAGRAIWQAAVSGDTQALGAAIHAAGLDDGVGSVMLASALDTILNQLDVRQAQYESWLQPGPMESRTSIQRMRARAAEMRGRAAKMGAGGPEPTSQPAFPESTRPESLADDREIIYRLDLLGRASEAVQRIRSFVAGDMPKEYREMDEAMMETAQWFSAVTDPKEALAKLGEENLRAALAVEDVLSRFNIQAKDLGESFANLHKSFLGLIDAAYPRLREERLAYAKEIEARTWEAAQTLGAKLGMTDQEIVENYNKMATMRLQEVARTGETPGLGTLPPELDQTASPAEVRALRERLKSAGQMPEPPPAPAPVKPTPVEIPETPPPNITVIQGGSAQAGPQPSMTVGTGGPAQRPQARMPLTGAYRKAVAQQAQATAAGRGALERPPLTLMLWGESPSTLMTAALIPWAQAGQKAGKDRYQKSRDAMRDGLMRLADAQDRGASAQAPMPGPIGPVASAQPQPVTGQVQQPRNAGQQPMRLGTM